MDPPIPVRKRRPRPPVDPQGFGLGNGGLGQLAPQGTVSIGSVDFDAGCSDLGDGRIDLFHPNRLDRRTDNLSILIIRFDFYVCKRRPDQGILSIIGRTKRPVGGIEFNPLPSDQSRGTLAGQGRFDHGRRVRGRTPRALASLPMLTRPRLRSPRSMPPM